MFKKKTASSFLVLLLKEKTLKVCNITFGYLFFLDIFYGLFIILFIILILIENKTNNIQWVKCSIWKKVKISRFIYLCHVEMASRLCHTSDRIMRASAKLYLQIRENFLQIYEDCDVKHCLFYVLMNIYKHIER